MIFPRRITTRTLTVALALALALGPVNGMGSPAMKSSDTLPSVIPFPRSWDVVGGNIAVEDLQRIVVAGDGPDLADVAEESGARLGPIFGHALPVQVAGAGDMPTGSLVFRRVAGMQAENYELQITGGGVTLSAADAAGFRHGTTTLVQLVVNGRISGEPAVLPRGVIRDGPRFQWRGMLLDCGRHFMPVPAIKALLDKLALHKFNVLHWHLTEDQGWRLEVPRYRRLTEIGAWRAAPEGGIYGGYYTSEDVRDVVAYAAERSITVVPEIEMPGHSQAALAAYPELSCTGGPFEVQTQWGIHEDVFCAGRDETFAFLEDVLDHVMELFPGPYIHIGGDEVPKARWEGCARCQARIRDEGLAGEEDLQSWFIARIAAYLAAHGRRLIGWDEILSGGLPGDPGAYTVQAWRGLDKAADAARAGHDVIASPTSHAYFDYDPGVLDLQQVYDFRPVPDGLDPDQAGRVLGGQMNLWTEYIPPERVDAMLFPRLTAMAEALWTGSDSRDFASFGDRLEGHGPVLELLGVRPGAAARPLVITGRLDPDLGFHRLDVSVDPRVIQGLAGRDLATRFVILESPLPGSFTPDKMPEDQGLLPVTSSDDTVPDDLEIPSAGRTDTSWLALARLFVDDRPYGAPALLEISGHATLGAAIDFARAPSERYPGGGEAGLVNGLHGSRYFRDGLWTGFEGCDLDATLDLGRARNLGSVSIRFLQDANAWIFLPREVRFFLSTDGETWREAGRVTHQVSDREQAKVVHEFALDLAGTGSRYVRVLAVNPRTCPEWHPGRGEPCWIFADEIVVR